MKKRETRKLSLARETLCRLEEKHLQNVAGVVGVRTIESICICDTDICASAPWTLCIECNS
jgi:hypothetical protein